MKKKNWNYWNSETAVTKNWVVLYNEVWALRKRKMRHLLVKLSRGKWDRVCYLLEEQGAIIVSLNSIRIDKVDKRIRSCGTGGDFAELSYFWHLNNNNKFHSDKDLRANHRFYLLLCPSTLIYVFALRVTGRVCRRIWQRSGGRKLHSVIGLGLVAATWVVTRPRSATNKITISKIATTKFDTPRHAPLHILPPLGLPSKNHPGVVITK